VSLWDWAAKAYAAPDVKGLCLDLQDRFGQQVCLLLWAAWAAQRGDGPEPDAIGRAAAIARAFETTMIGPLRAARRAAAQATGLDDPARQALTADIQAAELAAERALLELLEPLSAGPMAAPTGLGGALSLASAAWGDAAPDALLHALAESLARA
jgi:uncharacterized protein (TIGR02444 family)